MPALAPVSGKFDELVSHRIPKTFCLPRNMRCLSVFRLNENYNYCALSRVPALECGKTVILMASESALLLWILAGMA